MRIRWCFLPSLPSSLSIFLIIFLIYLFYLLVSIPGVLGLTSPSLARGGNIDGSSGASPPGPGIVWESVSTRRKCLARFIFDTDQPSPAKAKRAGSGRRIQIRERTGWNEERGERFEVRLGRRPMAKTKKKGDEDTNRRRRGKRNACDFESVGRMVVHR